MCGGSAWQTWSSFFHGGGGYSHGAMVVPSLYGSGGGGYSHGAMVVPSLYIPVGGGYSHGAMVVPSLYGSGGGGYSHGAMVVPRSCLLFAGRHRVQQLFAGTTTITRRRLLTRAVKN